MKFLIQAALVCSTFFFLNTAQAVDIAGQKIDDTIKAQTTSTPLKLNGAGLRYKIFFKVYVAALYLTEDKKNTAKSVFDLAGPKQINLTMLRDIKSDSLIEAFHEGLKKNTDQAELDKLKKQFDQLDRLFATVPELKTGDVIAIEWVPEVGTMISINGKKLGEKISDMAVFNALLRIWIGENPVSEPLKNQLLGGER